MKVREAGLREGISEVIVTTKSASGTFNAAPIGIITRANDYFVKLYSGSTTLSNVMETSRLTANVTDDAVLFVKAAFKHLDESYFSLFRGFPVLREADSWIVFQAMLAKKSSEYSVLHLMPNAVQINREELKAINRGLNAVIEAAILATRYPVVKDEGYQEQIITLMKRYADVVEKCGGPREKEAMEFLAEKFLK
jgi:hypothetical protein